MSVFPAFGCICGSVRPLSDEEFYHFGFGEPVTIGAVILGYIFGTKVLMLITSYSMSRICGILKYHIKL